QPAQGRGDSGAILRLRRGRRGLLLRRGAQQPVTEPLADGHVRLSALASARSAVSPWRAVWAGGSPPSVRGRWRRISSQRPESRTLPRTSWTATPGPGRQGAWRSAAWVSAAAALAGRTHAEGFPEAPARDAPATARSYPEACPAGPAGSDATA